mmetsp:Transcript_47927/g.120006  ORF Transcript_47927/g.120006 Transcript_47927/m.120006 type:complete len:480 (-) Transcript_47927:368-1807(-)
MAYQAYKNAMPRIESGLPLATGPTLEGIKNEPFLTGVGISMYQNSGCGGAPTNWSVFGEQKGGLCWRPRVHKHESPDDCSPDFWNNYEKDIKLVKELGSNCFRFSFEWGKLEPKLGEWDEAAFKRYEEIIMCLLDNRLEPCVTLYHFVHPYWFEEAGGFDDKDNLGLFVAFCKEVFRRFGQYIKLWLTINEVAVVPYTGYVYGSHPPGGVGKFYKAGILYRNLLIGHSMAYKAMKAMPHGQEARIGIVHDWLIFEPKGEGWKYAHIRPICNLMNKCWGNTQFLEWFTRGTFTWKPFSFAKEVKYAYHEQPGLDWVGLNYYSRAVLSASFKPTCHVHEDMTDMPYGIYPDGMMRAIKYCAQLGKPIYITETGISTTCEAKREKLIRMYCDQIKKAVHDGYDVRGLMYWTLVDNFEWSYGFSQNFGLYGWDKDTNERIPRPGVEVIKDCFSDLDKSIPDLKIGASPDHNNVFLVLPEEPSL